jgi:hypothetical protein
MDIQSVSNYYAVYVLTKDRNVPVHIGLQGHVSYTATSNNTLVLAVIQECIAMVPGGRQREEHLEMHSERWNSAKYIECWHQNQ